MMTDAVSTSSARLRSISGRIQRPSWVWPLLRVHPLANDAPVGNMARNPLEHRDGNRPSLPAGLDRPGV